MDNYYLVQAKQLKKDQDSGVNSNDKVVADRKAMIKTSFQTYKVEETVKYNIQVRNPETGEFQRRES